MVFLSVELNAQSINIKGKVIDTEGNALPGVNISVKGTTTGVSSDANGVYSIDVPGKETTLVFSYVGFASQEVAVGSRTNIDVILNDDITALEEIVVVGYGTQKKVNLTGSVASIKGDIITKAQTSNTMTALAGQLPGVIAKQVEGNPGSGAQIYIRGVSTYRGGTSPAYIIDGIERTSADFARLDPNEIESVNILKDAASSAVFGMRGANGVILVTTKRGTTGRININYSGNLSIQNPTQLPEFANSADYARGLNKYMNAEIYTPEEIQKFADGSDPENYPNTDWYDLMFTRNVRQQTHNVTIKGGNEKVKYFTTFGYIDQKGMWERVSYERMSARVNLDAAITATTQLSVDISGRREHDKGSGNGSVFSDLGRNTPVMLAQYANGLWHDPDPQHVNILAYEDPELSKYSEPKTNVLLTRLELVQDLGMITKGLKIKGIGSYDKRNYYYKSWSVAPYLYERNPDNPDDYILLPRPSPSLTMTMNENEYREIQGHITYDRDFGEHSVSGLVMVLAHQSFYRSVSATRISFDSEAMDQMSAGNQEGQTLSGSDTESARLSYIGRVNYAFKNKYLFEANVRRDASENFHPDHRWGTFASVSGGWIISEEKFWKSLKNTISFLKARVSYGTIGSDDTGGIAFPYYSRFDLSGIYTFGNNVIKGLSPGVLPNEIASWETSTKTNLAVDMNLFNKIDLTFDYFHELRSDILAQRSGEIPGSLGASLPLENFGKVKNQGIEALINFRHTIKNVDFSIGANITYARNEILEMAEAAGTSVYLRRTGRPIHTYFGFQTDGIFQTQAEIDAYAKQEVAGTDYITQPGDIKYVNVNGDEVVNADDRTALGYGNVPNIIYGITGSVNWKGLDLSFLFQGAEQVQLHLTGGVIQPFYNDGNLPKLWVTEGWSEKNPSSRYPRLAQSTHNFPTSGVVQTYLFDASYLRLKNIEIGYSLPKKWTDAIRLSLVRFYVSGQNLLTFSPLKLVDPEINNTAGWQYPVMRAVNLGVNIQF
jgi:TonB-linked SusC/RagA family outer membrane protein